VQICPEIILDFWSTAGKICGWLWSL